MFSVLNTTTFYYITYNLYLHSSFFYIFPRLR